MSTENLKRNQFHDAVRSSEISEYIENSLDNFSNTNNNEGYWRLYNKDNPNENADQVKTVSGICFTFTALLVIGTYSSLY